MGKVQNIFGNGVAGKPTRSSDEVIISLKNAGSADIPFGAPVFMTSDGAVPFDLTTPQEFATFLGFAVCVPDKTPETYPSGQFAAQPLAAWKPGDVMEVLVRGGISVALNSSGLPGGKVYLRKSDGKLVASAGSSGSTVELSNVRIRKPKDAGGTCAEVIVSERNIL